VDREEESWENEERREYEKWGVRSREKEWSRKESGRGTDIPVVSEVTVSLVPSALAQADYTVSHLYRMVQYSENIR
jgi:hypothetical protein